MPHLIKFNSTRRKYDVCELGLRSSNTVVHSAENDRYHKCAGEAMKKCLIESIQVSEIEQGDPDDSEDSVDAYIPCIEGQAKTCNHPIMHHLFEWLEAYKKHAKQLEMLESEVQLA